MADYDSSKQVHELDIVDGTINADSLIPAQDVVGKRLGAIKPADIVKQATLDDLQEGSTYVRITPGEKADIAQIDGIRSDLDNLDKADIGLGNVDNTSDLNKPISTATQAALDALDKSDVGLDQVDNTSDLNKPISTATQAALDALENTIGYAAVQKIVLESTSIIDVFIYDTTTDSDSGAWRKRCQQTSWYNEPESLYRSATKEFPAVALIVAHVFPGGAYNMVSIYDMTDPSIPMWKVMFGNASLTDGYIIWGNGGAPTQSIKMKNGVLFVGGQYPTKIDFLKEEVKFYGNINGPFYWNGVIGGYGISSWTEKGDANDRIPLYGVNDVAVTVLDDAPVDSITRLPVPTFAIATDGGVGIIDGPAGVGTVVDMTCTYAGYGKSSNVFFDSTGALLYDFDSALNISNRSLRIQRTLPTVDTIITTTYYQKQNSDEFYYPGIYGDLATLYDPNSVNHPRGIADHAIGNYAGLTLLKENPTTPADGMVAYITDSYNTGWMQGDIKLATLSDTVVGTLGTDILTDEITGGVIDDEEYWTLQYSNTTWSITGGQAVFDASNNGNIYYSGADDDSTQSQLPIGDLRCQMSLSGITTEVWPILGVADSSQAMDADGIYTFNYNNSALINPFGVRGLSTNTADVYLDDVYLWEASDEEITNGIISASDGWTADGPEWVFTSGELRPDGTQTADTWCTQSNITTPGEFYKVQVAVTAYVGGELYIGDSFSEFGPYSEVGIHSADVLSFDTEIGIRGNEFLDADISDVYIWQAGAEQILNGQCSDVSVITDNPNGETLAIEYLDGSDRLKLTQATATGRVSIIMPGLTVGEIYEIKLDHKNGNAGGRVGVGNSALGVDVADFSWFNDVTWDSKVFTFKAQATTQYLTIQCYGSAGQYTYWDNISVREVTDVIENGEFSSDRAWYTGSNWAISNGVATESAAGTMYMDNTFVQGQAYIIQFKVSSLVGTLKVQSYFNSAFVDYSTITTNGVHTVVISSVDTQNGRFYFTGTSSCVVDDVKVYEAEFVNGTWQPVGNIAVNPSFDGVIDDTAWIPGSGVDLSLSNGNLLLTNTLAVNGYVYQELTDLEEGSIYEINIDSIATAGATTSLFIASTPVGSDIAQVAWNQGDSQVITFKAPAGPVYIKPRINSASIGATRAFNNITIRKVTDIIENGEFSSDRTWIDASDGDATTGIASSVLSLDGNTATARISNLIGEDISAGTTIIVQFECTDAVGGNSGWRVGAVRDSNTFSGNINFDSVGVYSRIVTIDTLSDAYISFYTTAGRSCDIKNLKVYEAELVNGTWQPVGNLISNPGFEGIIDQTVWSSNVGVMDSYQGALRLTNIGAFRARSNQVISVDIGSVYEISIDVTEGTNSARIRLGSTDQGIDYAFDLAVPTGTHVYTIKAITGILSVGVQNNGSTDGDTCLFNNISVKKIQNLVENGEFSTDRDWGYSGTPTPTISGGTLVFGTAVGGTTYAYQNYSFENGKSYKITLVIDSIAVGGITATFRGLSPSDTYVTSAGTYEYVVTANADSSAFRMYCEEGASGVVSSVAVEPLNIPDRSVNDNDLQVVGELTATPVGDGTDMVAYSGFSSVNYLEQPYNSDLDVGTGDLYISGWAKISETGETRYILSRDTDTTTSANRILFYKPATEKLTIQLGTTVIDNNTLVSNGQWFFFAVVRDTGTATLYINGEAGTPVASSADITLETPLNIGKRNGQAFAWPGSIALIRIGESAPSADQIKYIYETEKKLFNAGAQSTLYGSSDISDLAYDSVTDKLHVVTPDDVSVFQGLNRISHGVNGMSSVSSPLNVIAAHNDYVSLSDTAKVNATKPAFNLREEIEKVNAPNTSGLLSKHSYTGPTLTEAKVPSGLYPVMVFDDGALIDFTVTFDGFYYYANFSSSAGDINVMAKQVI